MLAAPWASWLPGAVPSIELIEASRYFRADPRLSVDAAALGQWWTFVALCLVVYAALPRIVLLVIALWRTRSAFEWTVVHLPGARELLYRLGTDPVEARALTPETERLAPASPVAEAPQRSAHGASTMVLWGDFAPDPEAA